MAIFLHPVLDLLLPNCQLPPGFVLNVISPRGSPQLRRGLMSSRVLEERFTISVFSILRYKLLRLGFHVPLPFIAKPGVGTYHVFPGASRLSSTTFSLLGIPNIYEALSLGLNNSTKLRGSCSFTYKKLGVGTCHVTLFLLLAK